MLPASRLDRPAARTALDLALTVSLGSCEPRDDAAPDPSPGPLVTVDRAAPFAGGTVHYLDFHATLEEFLAAHDLP
ncbi:MAG TPA: hypothetical protein VMT85_20985 [Thermoanaerobaculia bacterium]|nr:hypothetical protein [Thermoanaerobaculia bacterium]